MPRTIFKSEVLDYITDLGKVNAVENVHFNYAVSKTAGKFEKEGKDLKAAIEFPREFKLMARAREEIIAKYKKGEDTVKGGSFIVDEDKLREEISAFNKEHQVIFDRRKNQNKMYRQQLRETFEFEPHLIPLVPVTVEGKKAPKQYIPDSIDIIDLFYAACTIDWDTLPGERSSISVTPEVALRARDAVEIVGNIKCAVPEHQAEFASRIAFALHSMYRIWVATQMHEDYVNWLEEFEVRKVDVIEKYAKKNFQGEPLRGPRNEYTIIDVDSLNAEMVSLESEYADLIAKRDELMQTPVPMLVPLIPYEWLPENLSGPAMTILFNFIDEEKKEA